MADAGTNQLRWRCCRRGTVEISAQVMFGAFEP
jgi:hypothetical protein